MQARALSIPSDRIREAGRAAGRADMVQTITQNIRAQNPDWSEEQVKSYVEALTKAFK